MEIIPPGARVYIKTYTDKKEYPAGEYGTVKRYSAGTHMYLVRLDNPKQPNQVDFMCHESEIERV